CRNARRGGRSGTAKTDPGRLRKCPQSRTHPGPMIRQSKETDERREAGPLECWCLHGSVGTVSDFRPLAKSLATSAIGTRSVDLWRFLETDPLPIGDFGKALNA